MTFLIQYFTVLVEQFKQFLNIKVTDLAEWTIYTILGLGYPRLILERSCFFP